MKAKNREKEPRQTSPSPRPRALALLGVLMLLALAWGASRRLLPTLPTDKAAREAGALLKSGMEQQWRGDLRGAAESFKQAAARVPTWAEAHVHLGALYYEAREYDLSRQEPTRGVQLDPINAAGWGQLGKLYLTTGASEDAEKALLRAIELKPDRATYPAMLGEVYRLRGDDASVPKAIEAFRQALALNPENADAYHRLGLLYQRMGRDADAAVALTAATRSAPATPEPYLALAQSQRKLGRIADAEAAMRTFRRLEKQKRTAQEQREVGADAATRRRGDAASEPDNGGNNQQPTANNQQPLPQAAALLAQGRRAFYGESKPDEGIALFRQARQADPRHPDIPYNLGLALHFVGKLEEAEAAFRDALALNPSNPRYHAWIGTIRMGRGPGELDAAIVSLERSVALGPDYAYGHHQLGRAYLLKGSVADALPLLQRAVARNPRYREAYYSLGQAYLRLGKREEAKKALATHRRLDAFERERRQLSILARGAPNDPAPRLRLARFLAKNGDREGALRQLEGLLRAFPDHPEALAEVERLGKGFTTETPRHGEEE